jgi:DNA-binding CsgD family transcriptional regulator
MAEPKGPYGHTRAQVAQLRAAGLTVRQIAAALDISTQAVHYHLTRINKGTP